MKKDENQELKLVLFALSLKNNFSSTSIIRQLLEHGREISELSQHLSLAVKRISTRDWGLAKEELEIARKHDVVVTSVFCEDYPELLKSIEDPPLVIFSQGKSKISNNNTAVVGARRATSSGLKMSYEIANLLASNSQTVVSGLALGVDAAAHRGAIYAPSIQPPTIAVLGSGVLNVQPRTNIELANRVLEIGGLIVSEYGCSLTAQRHFFPRRNRIISGLSNRVVVVEASKRSGSLITAKCALEQGRDVYAVAGPPLNSAYDGSNSLLQQGAKLVLEPADLIDFELSKQISFSQQLEQNAYKAIEQLGLAREQALIARKVVAKLSGGALLTIDQLEADFGKLTDKFSVVISLLELENVISQQNGKFRVGEVIDSA